MHPCVVERLQNKETKSIKTIKSHSIDSFYNRLRDVCEEDLGRFKGERSTLSKEQAQRAVIIAREFGILKSADYSNSLFDDDSTIGHRGSEHLVEFAINEGVVVKVTIPPRFGLIPRIRIHEIPNLRNPSHLSQRSVIEYEAATPLEYLKRWNLCNEVFEDQVTLASVIDWGNGDVSFVILQPYYGGEPAREEEITHFFKAAGWVLIKNELDHDVYFNYAYNIMAIDACSRNCRIFENSLQPFDVITIEPSEEMEQYLELYPS